MPSLFSVFCIRFFFLCCCDLSFFIGKFQRFFRFLVQACCCSSIPLCLPLIFFKGAVWDGQRMGFAGRMSIIEKKGVGGRDRGREMEEAIFFCFDVLLFFSGPWLCSPVCQNGPSSLFFVKLVPGRFFGLGPFWLFFLSISGLWFFCWAE